MMQMLCSMHADMMVEQMGNVILMNAFQPFESSFQKSKCSLDHTSYACMSVVVPALGWYEIPIVTIGCKQPF